MQGTPSIQPFRLISPRRKGCGAARTTLFEMAPPVGASYTGLSGARISTHHQPQTLPGAPAFTAVEALFLDAFVHWRALLPIHLTAAAALGVSARTHQQGPGGEGDEQ